MFGHTPNRCRRMGVHPYEITRAISNDGYCEMTCCNLRARTYYNYVKLDTTCLCRDGYYNFTWMVGLPNEHVCVFVGHWEWWRIWHIQTVHIWRWCHCEPSGELSNGRECWSFCHTPQCHSHRDDLWCAPWHGFSWYMPFHIPKTTGAMNKPAWKWLSFAFTLTAQRLEKGCS